jgi:hypothetical protein
MSLTADYETEIRVPQFQLGAALGTVAGLAASEILRRLLAGNSNARNAAANTPQPELASALANIRGLPSMRIMRQALETIGREQGGSVTEDYEDCNGKRNPCVMGLKTPRFPRGVGVDVTAEGKVIFRYDEEGSVAPVAKSLCGEVCRVYATIAVLQAQKKLGYRVSARDVSDAAGQKQVVISATRD